MLLDYLVLHFVAQILAFAHLDHLLRSGMERLDLVALGNFVVHNYVIVRVVVADARALVRFAVRGGWTVRGDSLVGLGSSAHTVADGGGGGDVQRGQRVYGHVEGGVEDRIVGPDSGDRHDHHVVSGVAYVHVASAHVSVACARVGDDDDDHGEDGGHSVG